MTSLAEHAAELYALVPEQFTAARDSAAKQSRDDGDRELAAELKQLRRPTMGAWLVNQLARRYQDRLDELLDLGVTLRQAQDALDGLQLRALSRQRHQAVRALADLAGQLGDDAGHRVADAARREVEATLDAALVDEQAAEAVRSGRLMRPLASSGLDAVDLTDAVAAPEAALPPRRTGSPRSAAAVPRTTVSRTARGKAAPDPGARKARTAELREAARAADKALRVADKHVTDSESELAATRVAVDDAKALVADAEEQLAAATAAQNRAEQARRAADQAVKSARREREKSLRCRDAAHRALG